MTAEQAWQATLGQLQMEMPKATFDTWVRDTRFVSYTDGVITLGFHNAYACDWVASRLTSTLRRILVGILNREVELRFEVISTKHPEAELSPPPNQPDAEPAREANAPDTRFAVLRTSLEEALLQPEKVVTVPGYFLRWLPYLGPARAWIVVALRQAFFQTYRKTATANTPFEASSAHVARWTGMTRQALQNYLKAMDDDDLLNWFVTRVEKSHSRETNTYQFRLAMPLTPGDADRLRDWLQINGGKTDPIAALQKALELQPKEILPYPPLSPTPEQLHRKPTPRTVQQVVLEVCGLPVGDAKYNELSQLARKLETNILPAKDVLVLSHYFLLYWLPKLGSGPAWMLTVLRDQCYHNHHTGELRNQLTLTDGYRELAQALGLERPKTIGDWLPPLDEMARRGRQTTASDTWQKRQPVRDLVGLFIEKTVAGFRPGRYGKTAQWTLKIGLQDPLLPEHTRAIELLTWVTQTGAWTWVELLEQAQDADIFEARFLHDLRRVFDVETPIEARFLHDLRREFDVETPIEARFLHGWGANLTCEADFEARFLHDLRRDFDTLKHLIKHLNLKHLIKQHPPLSPPPSEPNPEPEQGAVGEEDLPETWDFAKLLEMGGVPEPAAQTTLKRIAKNPIIGTRFLAWMLYGYVYKTPPGEEKGIRSPTLFANSRAGALPDPDYLALAQHTPRALAHFRLRSQRYSVSDLTQTQIEILDVLNDHGFFTLLEGLTAETGLTPGEPYV